MGIALFFAAASNLRGELKVDRAVPGARTCVHSHPDGIGNLISKIPINTTPFSVPPKRFVFGTGNPLRVGRCQRLHCSLGPWASLVVRRETAYCLGYRA